MKAPARDFPRARVALLLSSMALLSACRTTPAQDSSEPATTEPQGRTAPPEDTRSPASSDSSRAATAHAEVPKEPAPEPLPEDLNFDRIVDLPVPSDLAVRVLHARAPQSRALAYFHGMCSSSTPADIWAKKAAEYGTVIMLRANIPCGDRPGNKWSKDPAELTARLDRALAAVKEARNGHLDTDRIALLGYSQGAHRIEVLAGYAPERYPWLILGGPPEAAVPANFKGARAVAVLGGDLENTDHMRQGVQLLTHKGIKARFFRLPASYHGTFGPKGEEVMAEVLAWTFEDSE